LKEFNKLRAVLKKATGLIDHFQEQAFSAGAFHVDLKTWNVLRDQLTAVLRNDGCESGPNSRAVRRYFFKTLFFAVQTGLRVISKAGRIQNS